MKGCLTLVLLLVIVSVAPADSLDDQYVQIFSLIQQADAQVQERPADALANYVAAQTALQRLKNGSPNWNSAVVDFRLSYLAGRIATLAGKVPPAQQTSTAAKTNSAAAPLQNVPPPNWESQIAALQDQVRQLQGERIILDAKLKEAFAVLPTESDPRELARTQEQLKSLQKENELLKLSLQKSNAPAAGPSGKTPGDKASAPAPQPNPLNQDATPTAGPDQASTLKVNPNEVSALRAENDLLKKKVASLEKATPAVSAASASSRQLAQAQAQVAALQSDKELLHLQLTALEGRLKQQSPANPLVAAAAAGDDSARITQLERERDDLRKQLATAQADATNAAARSSSPPLDNSRAKRVERERDKLQEQLTLTRKELANASRTTEAAAAQSTQHIAQLETERDNLQKQLALARIENSNALHSATSTTTVPPDAARIEALERERGDLRLQLAQANERAAVPHPAEQDRIKQLEQERDDLQKQLDTARNKLQASSVHTAPAEPDLQVQLAAGSAPVKVIEIPQDTLPPAKPLSAAEVASQAANSSANPLSTQSNPGDKPVATDQKASASSEPAPHKTPINEDRLNTLSAQISVLIAAQKAQQQQVTDLTKEFKTSLEKLTRPNTNFLTQQDLKLLADATRELEQARQHDDEQFRLELADLGKAITTPTAPPETASPSPARVPASNPSPQPLNRLEYVIQPGDTLTAIAHSYRDKNIEVTVEQILKANPGLQPGRLRVGQRIFIPSTAH